MNTFLLTTKFSDSEQFWLLFRQLVYCFVLFSVVGPITNIEWAMLDKQRFYPLSMLSSFTVRCCLYPLTLVRTRLQVDNG